MKKDIVKHVAKCNNCQHFKVEHLIPGGVTQFFEVLTWKCDIINIDFEVGLLKTRRQIHSIWVIVDMMIKSSHFIDVKSTDRAEDYARLYTVEIVRWHGIPLSIISDRGA